MRSLLIPIFAFLVLASCSKTPGYVISESKMAEILADIHTGEAVVEANGSSFRNDSTKRALLQSICMRHGVTTQELDTSLYWYGNNLQEYMKVYDKTISLLEGRIADAEKAGGKSVEGPVTVSIDGDSVNLWRGPMSVRNSAVNPTNFLSFSYQSDKNWERGDRYTVSVRPINLRSPLFMTIAVSYNDGTVEYVTKRHGSDERQQLTLVLDSTKSATSVYGTVHYMPQKGEVSYLDSISVVRTRGRNDNAKARIGQHTIKTR